MRDKSNLKNQLIHWYINMGLNNDNWQEEIVKIEEILPINDLYLFL